MYSAVFDLQLTNPDSMAPQIVSTRLLYLPKQRMHPKQLREETQSIIHPFNDAMGYVVVVPSEKSVDTPVHIATVVREITVSGEGHFHLLVDESTNLITVVSWNLPFPYWDNGRVMQDSELPGLIGEVGKFSKYNKE